MLLIGDETGIGSIVRDPPPGTPTKTGHPFLGESSFASGEVIHHGSNKVFINATTGRGVRNLPVAKAYFEALGYIVEVRDWGGVSFPDQLPSSGTLPVLPPTAP